jgi:NAD(P)-dependent dehydrogenase (short-subunit alcohol dehydrogenase family)
MSKMFNGEVALITGASSGIGRATAIAFAEEGARVVVSGRNREELAKTVNMISADGGIAIAVKADVSQTADVQAMVAKTVEYFGALHFAVNNAGISGDVFVPTVSYSETTWDNVIGINLKGVFLCMKYELPHLIDTKGAIVNMASTSGLAAGPIGCAYIASKHGVVGLTKAAAIEYADKGVRINAIAPAVIRTELTERGGINDPAIEAMMAAKHPMGRIGRPEEVASAALWLCSKAASFTTGHTLAVDGGWLIP